MVNFKRVYYLVYVVYRYLFDLGKNLIGILDIINLYYVIFWVLNLFKYLFSVCCILGCVALGI